MDLLHAHNRDRKAEGARGFWSSLTLLLGTTVVGASLVTSPVTVQAASDPTKAEPSRQVATLRAENQSQARQLDALERIIRDACYAGDHTCEGRTDFWPVSSPVDSPDHRTTTREVRTTTVVQPAEPEPTKTPAPAPLPTQVVDDAVKTSTSTVKDTVDSLVGSVVEATAK